MLFLRILGLIAFIFGVFADFSCPVKDAIAVGGDDSHMGSKPWVDGSKIFASGVIEDFAGKSDEVTSPILDKSTGARAVIGKLAQMGKDDVLKVVNSAKDAWSNGRGSWPQMSLSDRIAAMEKVVLALKLKRSEIVNALMWEICKTASDAAQEFDRTMAFIESTIAAFKEMDSAQGAWTTVSGIYARVRKAAIGIILCLGPFNYPFNETYATLIPALLAGNVVIMKIPQTGGLAHYLTIEAYAAHLPPGVINFVSGSGRATVGPIMETGIVDCLAFIGGSKAADAIIKSHPTPHKLKLFLQLEGKNIGVVMPDADIKTAVEQITVGATSFNGQRCTAIKLIFVHDSLKDAFLEQFSRSVSALKFGLPWQEQVLITPLPELNKWQYMEALIADALSHNATLVNAAEGGGDRHGNLVRPAIVYPVTPAMRVWHEEQFGPVIPVAVYHELSEILDYVSTSPYGQQAAVFTSNAADSAPLIDTLSTVVGRININTQCGRSPDSLPFSGRRSSALGTMSITEAIRAFSVDVVVAGKHTKDNEAIMRGFEDTTSFLKPLMAAADAHHEL